jgi:hypothetical protein
MKRGTLATLDSGGTFITNIRRDETMAEKPPDSSIMLAPEERRQANEFIVKNLQRTMSDGRVDLSELRRKLSTTYWIVVVLSIVMFAVGIVLISVPVFAAFQGRIGDLQSLIAAGFGIADLAALFLFRPLERIHGIMGDMSQIILALNSFQSQLGLRLMEMDMEKRSTLGQAAEHISEAAKESIVLVQRYFEAREAG